MFGRFFSELKQRNVVRVAAVYTVTAWALFQIARTVFETFSLPKWTSPTTLILLALGLPIAMIIAWAFERGPDGAVRRTRAGEADAPRGRFGVVDGLLLGGMVLVLAVAGLQISGVIGAPGEKKATLLAAGVPEKSVAVLPFAYFSAHPDSEYFADGLTEEVINGLAQVPDLKVSGRTSAFYFKGRNEDLREVGRRLGVAHVVEGSVRREGDRLRVTAQLINVADGFNIWSKTYDVGIDDAFKIQTEIANSVAEALKAKLRVGGPGAASGVRNPEAYRLELIAKAKLRALGLAELTSARELYRQLIKLEPRNADAYAGYAQTTMLLAQNYLTIDFSEAERESRVAIDKAIAVNPKAASGYVAKGMLCTVLGIRATRASCDAEGAAAFKQALALEPRNPDILTYYANHLGRAHARESIAIVDRALTIDPLNRVAQILRASALEATGQTKAAEEQYRATIQLFPEFVDAKQQLAELYLNTGRLDTAEIWYAAAAAPATDPSAAIQLAHVYYNLGMPEQAAAALAAIKQPPPAVAVARAIEMVTARRYPQLIAYCRAELAKTDDPLWRSCLASAAALVNDPTGAREQLVIISPEFFDANPTVSIGSLSEAIEAAWVSQALGDNAQARRILDQLIAVSNPKPGIRQSHVRQIARMQAFEMMGQRDRALAELQAAVDQGYRTLIDIDAFTPLEAYPTLAGLKRDPRFQALVAKVRADNARMRQAVLARRGG